MPARRQEVIVKDVRISRSPLDPARHQLTITVGADRYRALAYLDNRGTINGARIRGYSSLAVSSVAIPGDQFQFDLFSNPSSDFYYHYVQAKVSLPLNADGVRLSVAASYGKQFQRFPDQTRGEYRASSLPTYRIHS